MLLYPIILISGWYALRSPTIIRDQGIFMFWTGIIKYLKHLHICTDVKFKIENNAKLPSTASKFVVFKYLCVAARNINKIIKTLKILFSGEAIQVN